MFTNFKSSTVDKKAFLAEWQTLHQSDDSRVLDTLTTAELRKVARGFGLVDSHAKLYGNTSYKKTWQAAIRVAIMLFSSTVKSSEFESDDESSSDEDNEFDDDDDDFNDDDMALHSLNQERAQFEKDKVTFEAEKSAHAVTVQERAEFEARKLAFESIKTAHTVTVQERAQFEIEKAQLESEKSARAVTVEERANLSQKLRQLSRKEETFLRNEKDLEKRQALHLKDRADFEACINRTKIETAKKETEIRKLKDENKKRKRLHDRAIADVTYTLKRLKGEKYWTYSPPSSWTGTDALLWNRYKCKSLVGGNEFSSDQLRVNGRAPKWRDVTAVRAALCAAINLQ